MRRKLKHYTLCIIITVFWCCYYLANADESLSGILERFKTADFSKYFGAKKVTFRQDNLAGSLFKSQPGYINGGTLATADRRIGLAVFESHTTAMNAVRFRIKDVANKIEKGKNEQNGITDWWYCEEQGLLSLVDQKLVFEVSDLNNRYSKKEKELWMTVLQLKKIAEQRDGADTLQRVGRSVTENAEEAFSAPSLWWLDMPTLSNILRLRGDREACSSSLTLDSN